jgi:hypothetical protein
MPTFLTTPRMSPELAARVQASVNGRRATPGSRRRAPHLIVLVRLAVVVLTGMLLATVLYLRARDRDERESERASLAADVTRRRAALDPQDQRTLGLIESWLVRGAGQYEGDVLTDALRAPGALSALVSNGAVYVRGEQAAFRNAAAVSEAAKSSFKDAFLLCLLEPPPERVEKALLVKARLAYSRPADLEAATEKVRALKDAVLGMPFLSAAFTERVRAASELSELHRLRSAFDRAPLDAAIQAAKARLLVFVVDEPSPPGGPVELDGEKAHNVRVGIIDLISQSTLLRLRRHVDPAWISAARRVDSANVLDSCALALDVHESVAKL